MGEEEEKEGRRMGGGELEEEEEDSPLPQKTLRTPNHVGSDGPPCFGGPRHSIYDFAGFVKQRA